MDPIAPAGQAAQLVTDYGTLGAVLLGASIIIVGLMLAVVVLWRAREEAQKAREEAQKAHYEWAVSVVSQQATREHAMTESLNSATAGMTTIRELLIQLVARQSNG